jgi:transcriptional regulator with GAF, ATPase, and Fis domain
MSGGGSLKFSLTNRRDKKVPRDDGKVVPLADIKSRERESILAALEKTNGKVYGPGGAARLLGIKPTTLASKMKSLGIKRSL